MAFNPDDWYSERFNDKCSDLLLDLRHRLRNHDVESTAIEEDREGNPIFFFKVSNQFNSYECGGYDEDDFMAALINLVRGEDS